LGFDFLVFSNELLEGLSYAEKPGFEVRSFQRKKRGILGIVSKIGKGGSKLLGMTGGNGGQSGDGTEDSENSLLKERMQTDKDNMSEFTEKNKDPETLKDDMSNLEITNDVSFDGFNEFKMADTRVQFMQEDRSTKNFH